MVIFAIPSKYSNLISSKTLRLFHSLSAILY
jgi:hypothetical protein